MSEQEKKPTPEEILESRKNEFKANLSGDLQKNAIDFAEFMKNSSADDYLGECVCFTVTNEVGDLHVFFGHQSIVCTSDFDFPISDELKNFVWSNVNICSYCGEKLPEGVTIQSNACRQGDNIIFGKKFNNLCNCPICFNNPDAETFDKIKKLVEVWKLCIDGLTLSLGKGL